MCSNIGFVIVIITSFYIICSVWSYQYEYGDACGKGATAGVCKKVLECPSASAALEKTLTHPYERCLFLGDEEIACCPDFQKSESPQVKKNASIADNSIWETRTIKPINPMNPIKHRNSDGKRKSAAACEVYIKETQPSIAPQIIAGEDARLGDYPHMAQLGYEHADLNNVYQWLCGGSLIHPRFVLTAAHCVQRTPGSAPPTLVRLGFVDITFPDDENPVECRIQNYMVHPKFDRVKKLNDIALIQLVPEDEVKRDRNVYPACLYEKNDDPKDLSISGWGTIDPNSETTSRKLQRANMDSIDLKSCNEIYAEQPRIITPEQICCLVNNSMVDTCQGDSGGPLQKLISEEMYVYAIVGVTSFGGPMCGDGKTPGVYIRVYSYLDWIESIVWP